MTYYVYHPGEYTSIEKYDPDDSSCVLTHFEAQKIDADGRYSGSCYFCDGVPASASSYHSTSIEYETDDSTASGDDKHNALVQYYEDTDGSARKAFQYDGNGNVTQVTDCNTGSITKYEYVTLSNFPTGVIDKITLHYNDSFGTLPAVPADPSIGSDHHVTLAKFYYDAAGNGDILGLPTRIMVPSPSCTDSGTTTVEHDIYYDKHGNVTEEISPGNDTDTSKVYPLVTRYKSYIAPGQPRYVESYFDDNDPATPIAPYYTCSLSYDTRFGIANRKAESGFVSSIAPGHSKTLVSDSTYNQYGQMISSTDPLGRKGEAGYNQFGQMCYSTVPVTNPGTYQERLEYHYNKAGEAPDNISCKVCDDIIRQYIPSLSNRWQLNGLQTTGSDKTKPVEGSQSFTYNKFGNKNGEIIKNNTSTTCSNETNYNEKDLLENIKQDGNRKVVYVYNEDPSSYTPVSGVINYVYDKNNRLCCIYQPDGKDTLGNTIMHWTTIDYYTGSPCVWTGMPTNYIKDITYQEGEMVKYTYDGLGRIATEERSSPDSIRAGTDNETKTYTYFDSGNIEKVEDKLEYKPPSSSADPSETVFDKTTNNKYYNDGQIKSVEEDGNKTQYEYDHQGRLVNEIAPDNGVTSYEYYPYTLR